MKVTVSDAKGQLTELVRRAESGEEVVLTRHGHPAVKLVPVEKKPLSREERRQILEDIVASARPTPGPDAAHSQDFLYDENGLPK